MISKSSKHTIVLPIKHLSTIAEIQYNSATSFSFSLFKHALYTFLYYMYIKFIHMGVHTTTHTKPSKQRTEYSEGFGVDDDHGFFAALLSKQIA